MQTKQPNVLYILDPTGSGFWDGLKIVMELVVKDRVISGDKFLSQLKNKHGFGLNVYKQFANGFETLY